MAPPPSDEPEFSLVTDSTFEASSAVGSKKHNKI